MTRRPSSFATSARSFRPSRGSPVRRDDQAEGGFAAAEGTPPLPALTLRLEPLPAEDARTLAVAAAGDRRLTEEELAALMERGAGNPLFLQKLASVGEKADEAEELPETVEALVATRIDQLGPGDRASASLGVRSGRVLLRLTDRRRARGRSARSRGSEAWDRLGEFVERDPNVPGAFRFRHALIRDAAYEGLSYRRRRELHGRVAEVIEQRHAERLEDAAELLSLHYFNAGRWPEAWTYSRLAGDSAREVYANVDAARFYERAIEASAHLKTLEAGELASAWRALGEVREAAGDYRGAIDALKAASRLPRGHPVALAEIHEARALAWTRLGSSARAPRYDGRAELRREARRSARPELGATTSSRSAPRSTFSKESRVRRSTIALKVVERAQPLGPSRALARAYSALDGGYLDLGEPEKAVHEVKALEIYREIGAARSAAVIESNLGVQAYAEGRWRDASTYYTHSQEELERLGDSTQAAFAGANLGEVLISRGLLDEAEPRSRTREARSAPPST